MSVRRARAGHSRPAGGNPRQREGEFYIATAKGIAISTAGGKPVHTIGMHDRAPNCAFDADGKTLYVTARGFLYRIRPEGKGVE
jgi:sugar lactone lactonase YvrE